MFIEVTEKYCYSDYILINLSSVERVYVNDNGDTIIVLRDTQEAYKVKETYEEVKNLIRQATGVGEITKKDNHDEDFHF